MIEAKDAAIQKKDIDIEKLTTCVEYQHLLSLGVELVEEDDDDEIVAQVGKQLASSCVHHIIPSIQTLRETLTRSGKRANHSR